jgi:SAM-dependent methyltransferase
MAKPSIDVFYEELKALGRFSGDPWIPGNPYFAKAAGVIDRLWERLVWPLISDCDLTVSLDLAAGHGRNSVKLLPLSQHLFITDIQPGNVAVCDNKFSSSGKVTAFVGSGFDFRPVEDEKLTFIYCFDAMIHFDSDVVRSYLRDARRVLRPGGRGFFHHSNLMMGPKWQTNPANRNFMSAELFAHYATKEGHSIIRQKVIDWSIHKNIDCLTVIERRDG